MADYTQPVTNSPPNIFIKTMQMGLPGIQLPQIFGIYKSAAQKDPEYVAKTDPADLADEAIAAAKEALGTTDNAAPAPATATTTPGSGANLGTTTVTAQRPQADRLNTDLASPYRGTTQELANPENPAASGQSQFDPAAMQAAQQKYADYVNNSQLARGAGQFFAAMGGANAQQAQAPWEAQDKLQEAITIGAQKAMQEQATAGTTNATALQNMAQTAGKYQGTQQEQQQKLDTSMIALKQNQMLNTPGTRQAKVAELMAQKYATQTGNALPKDFVGKYSVADMATLGLLPKDVIANYIDLAKGRTENAGADIAQGVAGAVTTKPQPVALSGAGTERLKYSPLPIPGGGALQPRPQDVIEANAQANKKVAVGDTIENWNTFGKPAVARVRESLNDGAYAGKGNQLLTAILPITAQQKLLTDLARLNDINPTLLPPALAGALAKGPGSTGFNGQLLGSMTPDTLKYLMNNIEKDQQGQITNRVNRTKAEASGVTPSEYPTSPEAQSATSAQPVKSGLPIVTSQAQLDALAPGTKYQDKTGKTYTKPKGQ